MKKIAFLFPGQGSQYVGMGKEFYDAFPAAREVFACSGEAAGMDVKKLCFEESDKINITRYTQIAMVTVEAAILAVLREQRVSSCVNAGLSLGEYTALLASGVMKQEDIFRAVKNRGVFMEEAYPRGGAMAAVLGAEAKMVESVCQDTEGIVSIANDNCPGQIVISGEEKAVNQACALLIQKGAKRCVPLNVSGPFHSVLLEEAGRKLSGVLDKLEMNAPEVPYISNVTADYVTAGSGNADFIRNLLVKQVSSPVLWNQSMKRLLADGTDLFVEIGPGKTLSGFMRRIDRNAKVCHVEKPGDLEEVIKWGTICRD